MSVKHLSLSASLALPVLLLLAPVGLADEPSGDDYGLLPLGEDGVWPAAYCPPEIAPVYPGYVPAQSYWGRNGYIEYVPGNMPIIISAPHGGNLMPDEIRDRTYGMLLGEPTASNMPKK